MSDDELRQSLQNLYELAPCGYIFTLSDGTITRVNNTFLDWTGYARHELESITRFQDLLTVPGKIFYENQYDPLLRMQGSVKEVAFDLVRREREPLPVLVNSVLHRGGDGPPFLIASIIFDATDRRTYERELLRARREAERLAAIVTASGDAIVTATPEGAIETWNDGAQRLFGYPADAMRGGNLADVLPALDPAERGRILAELGAGRTVFWDTVGRHAGGGTVDVSVGFMPHPGPLGDLASVSAIIRDISERKAAERLQHEFLAMVSHELRNPIGVIRNYAQLMRRLGSYNAQAVEAIAAQTQQLGRLVEDLLLASRIAVDQPIDLRAEAVDLVAVVQAAVEHRRAEREEIRIEAPAVPIIAQADRQRLGQVLANLLTNAVKYSPPGSDIVVRVMRGNGEARIEVADNGVGIPPEALPHLFDRFYRVEATATSAPGVGLGLYITRRIVEAHGGRIAVTSTPMQGSTFTVTLPLVA